MKASFLRSLTYPVKALWCGTDKNGSILNVEGLKGGSNTSMNTWMALRDQTKIKRIIHQRNELAQLLVVNKIKWCAQDELFDGRTTLLHGRYFKKLVNLLIYWFQGDVQSCAMISDVTVVPISLRTKWYIFVSIVQYWARMCYGQVGCNSRRTHL